MISGVQIIVVTGAPGSGKDMFLEDVAADPWFRRHAIIEAEAAAWIITGQRMKREDFGASREIRVAFQQTVAASLRLKRLLAVDRAIRHGKKVIVFNRFISCGEAYMPGGILELCDVIGMSHLEMINGIDAVIWTAPPPEKYYVQHDPADPDGYRFEPYALAIELGRKVREAYGRLGLLPVYDILGQESFDLKRENFMAKIRTLAGAEY